MSNIFDLRLIRTQPWEGGIYQIDTTNGTAATRYDARIIEENIRVAHGWCSNMEKPDKKLLKHLRKALKRAVKQ